MGYCYGYSPTTGRQMLACDNCGNIGGVRKRTCPYKVRSSSLRTVDGQRYELPYCPAPALCTVCYALRKAEIHKDCVEGARVMQEQADAEQAKLDAGWHRVTARWGDWHELVPAGMVGVSFGGATWGEDTRYVLVSKPDERTDWLEDIPTERITVWEPHA